MQWPPIKSWTSRSSRKGFRHFVAINYGGTGEKRWVLFVAVLDGKCRFLVKWRELNDSSQWISGWLKLSREEANPLSKDRAEHDATQVCLHASQDSGLLIPSGEPKIRPWD